MIIFSYTNLNIKAVLIQTNTMKSYKSIFVKRICYKEHQILMDRRNDHYYLKVGKIPEFNGWLEISIQIINNKKIYFDNFGNEYRFSRNSIFAIY